LAAFKDKSFYFVWLRDKSFYFGCLETKVFVLAALKDKGFYLWLREKNTVKGLSTRSIDSKTHIKEAP